jgi:enoyl-CoA hydratase/carnithine racemase
MTDLISLDVAEDGVTFDTNTIDVGPIREDQDYGGVRSVIDALGLNEVSIGLPVPMLAMELARDRLSKRALVQATLLGRIYDPDSAVAAGYLDEVVPAGEVLARAKDEAARVGAIGPMPFHATKTRLRGATIEHVRASLEADMRALLAPVTSS